MLGREWKLYDSALFRRSHIKMNQAATAESFVSAQVFSVSRVSLERHRNRSSMSKRPHSFEFAQNITMRRFRVLEVCKLRLAIAREKTGNSMGNRLGYSYACRARSFERRSTPKFLEAHFRNSKIGTFFILDVSSIRIFSNISLQELCFPSYLTCMQTMKIENSSRIRCWGVIADFCIWRSLSTYIIQ